VRLQAHISSYPDQEKAAFWVGIERTSPDLENNEGKKSRYIRIFTVLDSTHIFKGLVRETCAPDSRAHCL